jgi:RNA polymerase sigma-70 factor, ECF subfamily
VRIAHGPDERPDHLLVQLINEGDERAFETIYYRYRDWVARLAHRFTGNHADALDVLQETFAYFHRKFPGFELTARLTTFLYPVVKNLSIQARRRRDRHAGSAAALDRLEDRAIPGRAMEDADLAAALAGLSDLHREALLMRYLDAMSIQEIAQALKVPEGTVKSRLHNAVEALKNDAMAREHLGGGGAPLPRRQPGASAAGPGTGPDP